MHEAKQYTCRTSDKLKATEFVVGSQIRYEIDGNNAKVKNSSGKQTKCTIVRVENLGAAAAK